MERFNNLLSELQKFNPELNIAFKDESLLMKIIGVVLFFNSDFMNNFITTIGNTVYFPNREQLEKSSENASMMTLCHEFMHTCDNKKLSYFYQFSYLFPLSLIPLVLLSFIFIWWPIALLMLVLCALPLPAPGRTYFELRGYTMSLFALNELLVEMKMDLSNREEILLNTVDNYNEHFVSFEYYKMWPFGVKNQLKNKVTKILSDEMRNSDVIYANVADALAKSAR